MEKACAHLVWDDADILIVACSFWLYHVWLAHHSGHYGTYIYSTSLPQ